MDCTNSWSLLKLMSFESVMPSSHLIRCCPVLLPPSTFPSIRVFLNESVLHIRWTKYWSFSFSISPFNEYWGLISFRMDWLDLLTIQGTLKSLLQIDLEASVLQHSVFSMVQLSHPHMTPRKAKANGPQSNPEWSFYPKYWLLTVELHICVILTCWSILYHETRWSL